MRYLAGKNVLEVRGDGYSCGQLVDPQSVQYCIFLKPKEEIEVLHYDVGLKMYFAII